MKNILLLAARAEADGHTLFMATMGNMTANQHLYAKMSVDPRRALHFVFMANPSLAASNVQRQAQGARRAPSPALGKISMR